MPPPILNLPSNITSLKINGTLNPICERLDPPQINNSVGGPMVPFWRQPLPRNSIAGSSETEGSQASSRINIQLKLQEKKQKQLAELKIIEEEIKQGKLGRQKLMDFYENDDCSKLCPVRQTMSDLNCGFSLKTPPSAKKHIDIGTIDFRRNSSDSEVESMNILLQKLQQNSHKNDNKMFNNFSSASGGLTKFTNEILGIAENSGNGMNHKQPSTSSTITSTTSENENNSLTRQMVPSRKKLLHHNLGNNLNVQSRTSPGISNCQYDHRQAYNSLEGKSKTETIRSSNSRNEACGSNSNANTNSIEKEKSLASQLIKRQLQRGNTPEILLAANHLESTHYLTINQHLGAGAPSVLARNIICNNTAVKQ